VIICLKLVTFGMSAFDDATRTAGNKHWRIKALIFIQLVATATKRRSATIDTTGFNRIIDPASRELSEKFTWFTEPLMVCSATDYCHNQNYENNMPA